VRDFLKSEANKKFDRDYDILYKNAQNLIVDNKNNTLSDVIALNCPKSEASNLNLQNIGAELPLLNIMVFNIDKFDTQNIPLVVYAPVDFDEKTTMFINGFKPDGTECTIDVRNEPDYPVIVINQNERCDKKGVLLPYDDETKQNSAERVSGKHEILYSVKCTNLSSIESWLNGSPELRLRIIGIESPGFNLVPSSKEITNKFFEPPTRASIDNVFYNVNIPLFFWFTEATASQTLVFGDQMKYQWLEEDGGAAVDFTVGISGNVSIEKNGVKTSFPVPTLLWKISKKTNDEDAGDALVNFISDKILIHNTGTIQFKLN
jgi:hypothetical protein